MRHSTRLLLTGLGVAGVIGLSACGGSSTSASTSTTQASTTVTSTTATSASPAAAGTVDCASTPGQTVTVDIGVFKFDPTPVQVKACDSVVWKNIHDQAHTSTGNGAQSWNTGNIAPGSTSQPIVIVTKGTLTYMCALHPFMKGAVEVS